MAKTELFVRKQSGGMFSVVNETMTTGNIFFVDSGKTTTGADSAGYGQNPDAPFLTIDYAVGQCTANNGDMIFVMPGHAETVSEAGGLDLDVAGISIIGLGSGTDQPTVTLDTADTADVDVDAANITIKNINFVANFADIAAAIDVNATDCTISGCRFTSAATNMNAVIWILGAAAAASNRLIVEDCYFLDRDASNTHCISLPGTSDGCVIRRNVMLCDCGTAAIGAAGIITNVVIADNYISNAATDADSGIELHASATGMVVNNRIGIALAGDATTGISAAGCAALENYVVDTGDRQGVLDPAAT